MGLTVTNTNTLQLLGILSRTEKNQSTLIEQLSTGLRINRGADDPAGLIALKSLEAELTSVDAAIANNQRTDAVLNVADQALGEVYTLLQEIEGLVAASSSDANLSSSEVAANQSQIDDAIAAIDRIVRTTEFNGRRLLDGSGSIHSTVNSAEAIGDLRIFSRGNLSNDLSVDVVVSTSAQRANALFGVFSGGTALTGDPSNAGTAEFAITGSLGTATLEIASGLNITEVRDIINAAVDLTGVSASISAGSALVLSSQDTGSANFLTVDSLNNVLDIQGAGDFSEIAQTTGTDAEGTINGQSFTADGQKVTFSINGTSGEFTLGTAFASGTSSFTVTLNGGFTFQLGTDNSTRSTIGIDALFAHKLGGVDVGGFLNELRSGGGADLSTAQSRATALAIVRDAVNDVAVAQGRIGSFSKFQVQPSVSTLQTTKTSLSQAKSVIADTDYAIATAELNKQSVLLNSGISLLGLANQQAAQILSLLT